MIRGGRLDGKVDWEIDAAFPTSQRASSRSPAGSPPTLTARVRYTLFSIFSFRQQVPFSRGGGVSLLPGARAQGGAAHLRRMWEAHHRRGGLLLEVRLPSSVVGLCRLSHTTAHAPHNARTTHDRKHWHPECVICAVCNKQISNARPREKNGKPVCPTCAVGAVQSVVNARVRGEDV